MNGLHVFLAILLNASPADGLDIKKADQELLKLPKTFIDKGACPFECCSYRTWKAKKDVEIYDRARGTKVVDKIKKDESVEGMTGEVESAPILVTVISDHVDDNGNRFSKGDEFYLLTYLGEGFFRAWSDGKIFDMAAIGVKDAFDYYSKDPFWAEASHRYSRIWWKKVKSRRGVVGWTKEDVFSGQDSCG